MKKLFAFISLSIIAALVLSGQNNVAIKSVTGSWMGKINAGALPLRIVFNLSIVEPDSLVATLDSPDQGVKNIKIGPVNYEANRLRIAAPLLLGEYNGIFTNDTLIEGIWKQAGRELPLNLTKLKTLFLLNRPQEPKPPFPYKSEDITFHNSKSNINLAGTLTTPQGNGPFPAVVLITGSGTQNRDEELLGHKPFLVIADHLTRNGIAVLRYDDRGAGKSQGKPATATTADNATDAEAAIAFLKEHPSINHEMTGLAGHSEGGLIAPIVASGSPGIAFLISLAGPGVPCEELLHQQNIDISLASGTDKKAAELGVAINRKLFAILKKEPDDNKAIEKMTAAYRKILVKEKTPPDKLEQAMDQFKASAPSVTSPWFRYFITIEPAKYWKNVKCPVLALNGEKDLQVAADVNLPAIEKAVRSGGNNFVKTIRLADLNHLFQHSKTGLPAEYGEIEETFSPEALQIMTEWILGLKASQQAF